MSIDHGKVLVACRRKLEAYRDAYGLEYVGGQELSSLLADIDRAISQPAEAVLDRPARVAGRDFHPGQPVQQVIGRANAHYDATHNAAAQPAEAVEGLREFIAAQRPLPADMAAFVSENWHKYADFPNPPTDAAQGAVAPDDTCVICPACAHQFRAIPMQVQSLLLAAGYSPPFFTHPQAAPAQGDWKIPISWADFWIDKGNWQRANDYEAFDAANQWLNANLAAAPSHEGES